MSLLSNWKFNWKNTNLVVPQGRGLCLDLGCGNGKFRQVVEKKGYTYIGCDVDIARGGTMVKGDGMMLPFKNNGFDVVLLSQVLEHVKSPLDMMFEVNRVMASGAKLYGSVSYLEPFHDKSMYFGHSQRGIEYILEKSGFCNIELIPGINAFSLILRGLLIRLLPKSAGESLAFSLSRIGVMGLVYSIFMCRALVSLVKRGALSKSYRGAYTYIGETAPFDFAGHIQFEATAK